MASGHFHRLSEYSFAAKNRKGSPSAINDAVIGAWVVAFGALEGSSLTGSCIRLEACSGFICFEWWIRALGLLKDWVVALDPSAPSAELGPVHSRRLEALRAANAEWSVRRLAFVWSSLSARAFNGYGRALPSTQAVNLKCYLNGLACRLLMCLAAVARQCTFLP